MLSALELLGAALESTLLGRDLDYPKLYYPNYWCTWSAFCTCSFLYLRVVFYFCPWEKFGLPEAIQNIRFGHLEYPKLYESIYSYIIRFSKRNLEYPKLYKIYEIWITRRCTWSAAK